MEWRGSGKRIYQGFQCKNYVCFGARPASSTLSEGFSSSHFSLSLLAPPQMGTAITQLFLQQPCILVTEPPKGVASLTQAFP